MAQAAEKILSTLAPHLRTVGVALRGAGATFCERAQMPIPRTTGADGKQVPARVLQARFARNWRRKLSFTRGGL